MDLAVGINHDAVYANYSMICLLQTSSGFEKYYL